MEDLDCSVFSLSPEQAATDPAGSRKKFTLDEEIALCNLIEEKKPMFRNPEPGCKWMDVKVAMDAFNGFDRDCRIYKDHYLKLLTKFKVNDGKAR